METIRAFLVEESEHHIGYGFEFPNGTTMTNNELFFSGAITRERLRRDSGRPCEWRLRWTHQVRGA